VHNPDEFDRPGHAQLAEPLLRAKAEVTLDIALHLAPAQADLLREAATLEPGVCG